ncbi:MAG TPA: hypothetical protein VL242_17625, partial [Sorangium sp.]|nr:hypothetical protein [Sorangium sp.]
GRVGGTDKPDHNLWVLEGDQGAVRLRDWSIAERRQPDGSWRVAADAMPNEQARPLVLRRQLDAVAAMACGEMPTLGQYMELDDQVLLGAIHAWEAAPDPVLADLARRLRVRSLFKALELFPEPGEGLVERDARRAEALDRVRGIAQSAGLDPDVYVGVDVAEDTPYAEDESLLVVYPRGRPRRPAEVSFLLDRLRNETMTRTRILFAPELRDAVREALIR